MSCHLLENLLPNVISQLVLVEMRTPGMSCQMIGNKIVNALSQILVGGLQSNNREVGQEAFDKQLPSRRTGWKSWKPRRPPTTQ